MEMSESRIINAPRDQVWAGLTNPEMLAACIPGCQEMTGSVEEGFEAVVVQKIGPVKAKFKGQVTLSDVVEGESCTILGEGKGGAAGFAKGEAKVHLADAAEGGTKLTYEAHAKVGGKLAQLGSRLIDGVAEKLADAFFTCFEEQFNPQPESEETAQDPSPTSET